MSAEALEMVPPLFMLDDDCLLSLPHSQAVRRSIRSLLRKKGITQKRLAKIAGIPERTLKRNLVGGRLRTSKAAKLCDVCRLDMAAITNAEDVRLSGPTGELQELLLRYAQARPAGAAAYRSQLTAIASWVANVCVLHGTRPTLIARTDEKFALQVKLQVETSDGDGEIEIGFEPALEAPVMHVAKLKIGTLRQTVANDLAVSASSVDRIARWLSGRAHHG